MLVEDDEEGEGDERDEGEEEGEVQVLHGYRTMEAFDLVWKGEDVSTSGFCVRLIGIL